MRIDQGLARGTSAYASSCHPITSDRKPTRKRHVSCVEMFSMGGNHKPLVFTVSLVKCFLISSCEFAHTKQETFPPTRKQLRKPAGNRRSFMPWLTDPLTFLSSLEACPF